MQVSCGQCAATYEFDAAMIPAEGYDAQCTTCNAVFFVAPAVNDSVALANAPVAVPVAPSAGGLVAVTCGQCGAVYQFSAADIPAGGYDAQCTQCQTVFFVSADGQAPAAAAPGPIAIPDLDADTGTGHYLIEPAADLPSAPAYELETDLSAFGRSEGPPLGGGPTPTPFGGSTSPSLALPSALEMGGAELDPPAGRPAPAGFSPVALDSGTLEPSFVGLAPARDPEEDLSAMPGGHGDFGDLGDDDSALPSGDEFADVMAINAELGEPIAEPEDEEDVERRKASRRRRSLIVAAAVGAVLVGVGGTFMVSPRAFDMTVGRLIGIKRTVNPAALPHFERGRKIMLDDTDEAYQEAAKAFEQALKQDPLFPDAIATAALAHIFRGVDLQAQGRAALEAGIRNREELKAVEALPPKRRVKLMARLEELRRAVKATRDQSTNFLETGGKAMSDGQMLLEHGMQSFPASALIAEATAIWYTMDPEGVSKAEKTLAHTVVLRTGSEGPVNLTAPPDAWAPFAFARLHVNERDGLEQARGGLDAALKKDPRFQRARWELAQMLAHTGQKEEATKLAHEILAAVPKHSKAQALLVAINQPAEPVANAPAAKDTPAKAELPGKLKGKKHKGKRH